MWLVAQREWTISWKIIHVWGRVKNQWALLLKWGMCPRPVNSLHENILINEQARWSSWRAGKKLPSRKGLCWRGPLRGHPKHDRRAEETSFRPLKTKQKQNLISPWYVVHVSKMCLLHFQSPKQTQFPYGHEMSPKRATFLFLFLWFFLQQIFFSLRFTHHPKAWTSWDCLDPPPPPQKKTQIFQVSGSVVFKIMTVEDYPGSLLKMSVLGPTHQRW